MLLRERAWDVMRTEMVTVRDSASLGEVIVSLRQALKDRPDRACVVVLSEEGAYKGVVSAWWLLLNLERYAVGDSLKPKGGADFEERFRVARRKCLSLRAGEVVDRDIPTIKPQDTLLAVLAAMLASKRRWAVVVEGGKALGTIAAEDLFMQMDWEGLGE